MGSDEDLLDYSLVFNAKTSKSQAWRAEFLIKIVLFIIRFLSLKRQTNDDGRQKRFC